MILRSRVLIIYVVACYTPAVLSLGERAGGGEGGGVGGERAEGMGESYVMDD